MTTSTDEQQYLSSLLTNDHGELVVGTDGDDDILDLLFGLLEGEGANDNEDQVNVTVTESFMKAQSKIPQLEAMLLEHKRNLQIFLNMPVDQVQREIDTLRARGNPESMIFHVVLQWVRHDEASRKDQLDSFLEQLDFAKIHDEDPNFLKTEKEMNPTLLGNNVTFLIKYTEILEGKGNQVVSNSQTNGSITITSTFSLSSASNNPQGITLTSDVPLDVNDESEIGPSLEDFGLSSQRRRSAGPSTQSTSIGRSSTELKHQEDNMNLNRERRNGSNESNPTWVERCRDLMNTLWDSPDALPFRKPVDAIDYPHYHNVIDTPMDLGKVKENLFGGSYTSPQELAEDMQLIFSNSKLYNRDKRSRIYTMTCRLQSMYESTMSVILEDWKHIEHPNDPDSKRAKQQKDPTNGHVSSSTKSLGPSRSSNPRRKSQPTTSRKNPVRHVATRRTHDEEEESNEEEEPDDLDVEIVESDEYSFPYNLRKRRRRRTRSSSTRKNLRRTPTNRRSPYCLISSSDFDTTDEDGDLSEAESDGEEEEEEEQPYHRGHYIITGKRPRFKLDSSSSNGTPGDSPNEASEQEQSDHADEIIILEERDSATSSRPTRRGQCKSSRSRPRVRKNPTRRRRRDPSPVRSSVRRGPSYRAFFDGG